MIPARILLVDDHPLMLEALEGRLRKNPELKIVGRATSGEEALEKIGELRPDVVMLDLRMPGMGGLEALRRIKNQFPGVAVIVLTVSQSQEHLLEAVLAGAAGYITKDSSPNLLVDAIRAVREGASVIRSELLRSSVDQLRQKPFSRPAVALDNPLSEREYDVLRLLVQGHSNKAIGEALNIVEATVKKHVHGLIVKLGVSDRTQVVIASIRLGLVEP